MKIEYKRFEKYLNFISFKVRIYLKLSSHQFTCCFKLKIIYTYKVNYSF